MVKIECCPVCSRVSLKQNDEYEDEYYCSYCKLSFEILLINETGKEVVGKGLSSGKK